MLWHPWFDVSDVTIARALKNKNWHIGFLPIPLLWWGKQEVEPLEGFRYKETDHCLRPIEHPFHSKVPIMVNTGTLELFYDDIRVFANTFEDVEGNTGRFVDTEDTMHDVILLGNVIGFNEQAKEASRKAAQLFEF